MLRAKLHKLASASPDLQKAEAPESGAGIERETVGSKALLCHRDFPPMEGWPLGQSGGPPASQIPLSHIVQNFLQSSSQGEIALLLIKLETLLRGSGCVGCAGRICGVHWVRPAPSPPGISPVLCQPQGVWEPPCSVGVAGCILPTSLLQVLRFP